MNVRSRSAAVVVALLLAALAAVAAPASGSPVKATIRVEGRAGTVIPTTTLATDARPIVSVDGVAHSLTVPSALTLAADAAQAAGRSMTCSWSDAFNDCFVSGFPTPFPLGSTDYWRLVLNGRDSGAGFAGTAVHDGDHVDVIATDFTAATEPPLLVVSPSAATVSDGTSFTVKVSSFDTTGAASPVARGRRARELRQPPGPRRRGRQRHVHGHGQRVLVGVGHAVRRDSIRRSCRVCAYGSDPTVCQLPAPATPSPPAAPAAVTGTPAGTSTPTSASTASTASADRIAPSSQFTAPLAFARLKLVKRLVGVVAPDRSDIASVSYALARRVGTLCRFRRANGTLAAATSCSRPIWLPARRDGPSGT